MKFLFGKVDSLDKVPEQFRSLYIESDDGYDVNPDFKGVVEAITGLNKSLTAARNDAKSKTVDLSGLSDFGETVEEIVEGVTAKIKGLEDDLAKGGDAKANLDKLREDMKKAHMAEVETLNKRSEALKGQLYNHLVENKATEAIVAAKGIPELLLPFVKNQIQPVEVDGKYEVQVVEADDTKQQRYSGVTGQPMSISELVTEMKSQEKFGRLFESETPAGGGINPGATARRPTPGKQPLTANQKIAAGLNQKQRTYGAGVPKPQ